MSTSLPCEKLLSSDDAIAQKPLSDVKLGYVNFCLFVNSMLCNIRISRRMLKCQRAQRGQSCLLLFCSKLVRVKSWLKFIGTPTSRNFTISHLFANV